MRSFIYACIKETRDPRCKAVLEDLTIGPSATAQEQGGEQGIFVRPGPIVSTNGDAYLLDSAHAGKVAPALRRSP